MKKIALALAVGLATTTSGAQSAEPGLYTGVGAGVHIASTNDYDVVNTVGTTVTRTTDSMKFETGYLLVGSLGYRWEQGFRTELEIAYRNAGAEPRDGHQDVLSGMANALFEVGIGTNFYPYLGAGVGIANTRWDSVQSGFGPVYHDESSGFQWQAIVGAEFPLNEKTNLFVDYRFISAPGNEFSGGPASRIEKADNQSHNALVGVRYRFSSF